MNSGYPSPAYLGEPIFSMTSDVDWASEDAIAIQQGIFDEYQVKATYFMTHHSPLLAGWQKAGKVDLAIHPNFLPNSSHGNGFEQVLDAVLQFAPEARCSRSHMYFDAAPITRSLVKRGFKYDSNLCTNLQAGIAPIRHESGLIRFPCFYEDGTHSWQRVGWNFKDFETLFERPGIKILSVHPMTIAMNVTTQDYWAQLKERFPPKQWSQMAAAELAANACGEVGPRHFLEESLAFIRRKGFRIVSLDDLYNEFGQGLSLRDELDNPARRDQFPA